MTTRRGRSSGGLAKQHKRRIRHDEPAQGHAVAEAERDVGASRWTAGSTVKRSTSGMTTWLRPEKLIPASHSNASRMDDHCAVVDAAL